MRIAGLALIVVALLGFGFVADDLDHVGELFGTSVILVAGIGILAASFITSRKTKENERADS